MKQVIEFITNNYTNILSILAFAISLINLLYLIITNRKKLAFNITSFTIANVNNKNFYMFNTEFINKSRLPISINEINIFDTNIKYTIIKSPRLLAEKSTTRNKEIIRHQEVHSSKFPINLEGLTSQQKFLVMYGPEDLKDIKNKIIINTNRGKIKFNLQLLNLIKKSDDFMNEASEYYD